MGVGTSSYISADVNGQPSGYSCVLGSDLASYVCKQSYQKTGYTGNYLCYNEQAAGTVEPANNTNSLICMGRTTGQTTIDKYTCNPYLNNSWQCMPYAAPPSNSFVPTTPAVPPATNPFVPTTPVEPSPSPPAPTPPAPNPNPPTPTPVTPALAPLKPTMMTPLNGFILFLAIVVFILIIYLLLAAIMSSELEEVIVQE